jgi:hypothetical protein
LNLAARFSRGSLRNFFADGATTEGWPGGFSSACKMQSREADSCKDLGFRVELDRIGVVEAIAVVMVGKHTDFLDVEVDGAR